jgi:hypothetical protein
VDSFWAFAGLGVGSLAASAALLKVVFGRGESFRGHLAEIGGATAARSFD